VRPLIGSTPRAAVLALLAVFTFGACTPKAPPKKTTTGAVVKHPRPPRPEGPVPPGVQLGLASWYGGKHHGGPTASGERFNKHAMTAAHRTLKMGTRVRVTRKKNGRSVVVRINDRGPYGRAIIDLSEAAAKVLDMIDDGIAQVRIEVIE
jgi:rare lipoprotein A